MLLFEYSRAKGLDRITIENFDCLLQYDRAVVKFFVDEVDSASCYLDAVFERLALGVDAGKSGQQRRMNIQDPILERAHEERAEQSHIAGEANQRHVAPPQLGYNLTVVFFSCSAFLRDYQSLNAVLPSLY
jgi:hypothetical protein